MSWRFGFLLSFWNHFIIVIGATECKPLAVSLPFKSNVLANRAEARGISWQIGGPNAQTIALLPSATYNDTYMYPPKGLCAANITTVECTTYRGGFYNSSLSQSETVGASIKHIWDDANATWTTDRVVLEDGADKDIEIKQYEFGVRIGTAHAFVNKGELGLGMNSSFLQALATGQRIASKSYSFFWGTDSTISDEPRNGSLTLGGYDQALIGDSPNTTTTFRRNEWRCREGMIVELTGLSLKTAGGTTQDIMEESERLQACVVPTLSSVLTLPYQYWDKMASLMGVEPNPSNNGTSGELFWGVASVRPRSATFAGNLSITINDALTVTIPNKQLMFDEPYISSDGQIRRNPDWKDIPVVKYTDLDQNMPRLGGMFFSSAYLMVNHDKNEFTISQAQEKPVAQKLMGIDTTNGCVAAVDKSSTTGSGSPNTSSDAGNNATSGLSGGAIAGIAVGIVAVVFVVAGTAFLIWRRRRGAAARTMIELEGNQERVPIAEKYGYNAAEMYAGPGHNISEFSGDSRDYAVEMDGSSRPSEVPAYERIERG